MATGWQIEVNRRFGGAGQEWEISSASVHVWDRMKALWASSLQEHMTGENLSSPQDYHARGFDLAEGFPEEIVFRIALHLTKLPGDYSENLMIGDIVGRIWQWKKGPPDPIEGLSEDEQERLATLAATLATIVAERDAVDREAP